MPIERNRIDYRVSDEATRVKRAWWFNRGMPNHLSVGSVLIGAMGNHWRPGCYDAVKAMANHTFEQGYQVTLYEQPDRCFNPGDALGSMRNEIYMLALAEGYQYILYVDNDVKPSPEVLVELMEQHVPSPVAPKPRFANGQVFDNIHASMLEPGMYMVGSCILSMILFPSVVLRPFWRGDFWEDAIGDDEEYHFDKLYRATGHRPFVNARVEVEIMEPPHFPLDARPKGRQMATGAGKGNPLQNLTIIRGGQ